MESLARILAEHPFLSGLDASLLDILVGCASNVRFNPGETIFRYDEPADHFYLIRHGKVAIEIHRPGEGPLTLLTVGPGDVLGWSWLVPPYRWRFDARAVELTRAIQLDGACLRRKCDENHDLGYELMKRFAPIIAGRAEAARLQLANIHGPHGGDRPQ